MRDYLLMLHFWILGILCLLVFSPGFRRFALWGSAVAVAALIGGFFYWQHVEQAQVQAKREQNAAKFQKECVESDIDPIPSDSSYYLQCFAAWRKAHPAAPRQDYWPPGY